MEQPLLEQAQLSGLMDLGFGIVEELHPDLKPHIVRDRRIPHISHPLMIELFYSPEMNHSINKRYEFKKKMLEDYLRTKNWVGAIACLIEKPYRIDYMIRYMHDIPIDVWWTLLHSVWTSVENLWQYRTVLPILFRGRHQTIPEMMPEPDDLSAFTALPGTLEIFRGCQWRNRKGWSWTTERKTAEFFARRFLKKGSKSRIVTALVRKQNILFYTNCRNEYEVVINPENTENKCSICTT
jgi:hypothetical protein